MTELKGWHVLTSLLGFFGVTIAVNAYFVTVALSSSTGEYQKKSYLQGLHYNDVIAARAKQAKLGWSAELSATPASDGAYDIAILIRDHEARPINRLALTGELRRPVQAAMDQPLTFQAAGDGLYRARAADVARGKWRIAVTASEEADKPVFRAEKELWLR